MNHGLTYPGLLGNRLVWWLWKKIFCPRNIHLFDEVETFEEGNYLYCDACGLMVFVDGVIEEDDYIQEYFEEN